MSNFSCDICKVDILEGPDGRYVTGCKHYPIEPKKEPQEVLADFERMLESEIDEAFQKWTANNHDWRPSWHYMLGVRQAKVLLKLAKMGPPTKPCGVIEESEPKLSDAIGLFEKSPIDISEGWE